MFVSFFALSSYRLYKIDESDTVVNTPICHHVFHQDCLLQWLERNDLCPYCRQLVVTEEQWKEAYQTFTNQSNP